MRLHSKCQAAAVFVGEPWNVIDRWTDRNKMETCMLQGLPLAIQALYVFNQRAQANSKPTAHVIMAGGYDKRLAENRDHFQEISELIDDLGMRHQVLLCHGAMKRPVQV